MTELSIALATTLSGSGFLNMSVVPELAGASLTRPSMAVTTGTWSARGTEHYMGQMEFQLRTRQADDEGGHNTTLQALVALLRSPASLQAAVEDLDTVSIAAWGMPENAVTSGIDGEDLLSTVNLLAIWKLAV